MRRTRFDDWDCPVARTTDLLGDWWTPLIIRSAFLGARRFDEFTDLLGIPRNVLAERLKRLVAEEVLERRPYQDRPVRYEYRLTERGIELFDLIVVMVRWGNRWSDWDDGPPLSIVDRTSGREIDPVLVDAATGDRLDPRQTAVRFSPGRGERGGRPLPPAG